MAVCDTQVQVRLRPPPTLKFSEGGKNGTINEG
nr:MAG TPA: hypothetical protein [Caudoviricetes sp.]